MSEAMMQPHNLTVHFVLPKIKTKQHRIIKMTFMCKSPCHWPGMADGGDGVAELAVDAAAVVELLVGVAWRALVLDAADAADAHYEDDEHEDEGHAQRPDDDVEGVAGHVGQGVVRVRWLPLQV